MAEVTLEDLVQVDARYAGDDWRRYDKMKDLFGGNTSALSSMLWQGFRGKKIKLGSLRSAWYNPEMFSYDDHELELEGITVRKDDADMAFHDLPDHLFSELVHQLHLIFKK